MGVLRSDRVSGLGGANAINGSVFFGNGEQTSNVTTNNVLITEESSDFTFGTGDFTIEGWFYTPDLTNWNLLVGDNVYSSAGGWSLYFNTSPYIDWWKGGAASVVSGGAVTANTWHHIAFSRESGTNRTFVDGALGASASDSTDYTSNQILIGANQHVASTGVSQWGFKGYASNVRVIKGEAIYTAAFTAPTTRLEKTDNTVLLCCQSPGNVLQEATGKTLSTLNTPVASTFAPDVGEDHGTTFEDNTRFDTLSYMVPPGGTTAQSNRGRAVIGWANNPVNTGMDYFSIQSMGNSISFGTLTSGNRWGSHALSSSTRGLFVGGYINTPASTFFNTIDYVTIATTSNPIDFGDVTTASYRSGCCSSSTRGIIALGFVTPAFGKVNTIDLVTIATLGNATNFGDLFQTRANMSSLSSPTRGVFAGGETPTYVNTIDYVTIATTGDASNFGDLNYTPISSMAMASTTRGIIGGGYPTPANTNIIDFITIASTGDATDFGDLTGLYSVGSATSNSIRGVFCGGYTSPSKHNLMEFVTIATTGNASDFGDMLYSRRDFGACSDSHGGIS